MPTGPFEWDSTDRYENEKGTELARILCVDRDEDGEWQVKMERWNKRAGARGRRTRFVLSLRFFRSGGCGWRKVQRPNPA